MFTTEHKTCMESLRYVMGVLRILLSRETREKPPVAEEAPKMAFPHKIDDAGRAYCT